MTPPSPTVQNETNTTESSQPHYSWLTLGQGSYNHVWKSNFPTPQNLVSDEPHQGEWVLKHPIPTKHPTLKAMSEKHRSVRLWREINPDLPKAGILDEGWVAPFIQNTTPAKDEEIAQKLIDIYCNTRRIIVDAATEGNFLTRKDTGETILVDVDLALKRSESPSSINFSKILEEQFATYWENDSLQKDMSKTIEITRNLLFFEDCLDSNVINELQENGKINLKNILTLTWFRENKKILTEDLFDNIALLNDSQLSLSDRLLEALAIPSPGYLTNVKRVLFFPSDAIQNETVTKRLDSSPNPSKGSS